ncbi:NAD-dependent protein deacetylase sirtuin-6 [Babesia caballi]|uniref:NAD-dependent protein deacetylase sirtuin-6 n=1 Tax=Babesia caballi TaxID=5871 RepID=A0AAV4LVT9_BABCB|nr:NAD-dependent protein deacetylase sirtuin-6 [Babesia caballi]
MPEPDGGDTPDEIIELTEGWSLCNDDVYRVANQLLSLAFAVKYFGECREFIWTSVRRRFEPLPAHARVRGVLRGAGRPGRASGAAPQLQLRQGLRVAEKHARAGRHGTGERGRAGGRGQVDAVRHLSHIPTRHLPPRLAAVSPPRTRCKRRRFSYGEDSCDHVFDLASITELIRSSRCMSVDCPVAAPRASSAERRSTCDAMASSALNYATQLRRNDNKGPCGGVQLFDSPADVSRKFKKLLSLFNESKCAVLHTGAGVSTAAGIPDFRGPSGVWTVMSQENQAAGKRRKMTDGDCTVKSTTEACVEYGREKLEAVEFSQALPSEAHLATLALLRAGRIRSVITQNIDGLHAVSGMRHSECTELHGNVFLERCISCGRRFLRAYVAPTISFKPTGSHCGICFFPPCGILTDVVLDWFDRYEDHFEKRAVADAEAADFHLTLGSSLHVEPACLYASSEHHRKEDAPLVIVNYQKTRLDAEADVVLHYDVNKVCTKLVKHLKLPMPIFLRRFLMVGVQYSKGRHNKVLLRFPCISRIVVSDRYTSASGVSHRCVHSAHGMHEFTFTGDFEAVIKLLFDAEVVIRVRYAPDCGMSCLVWQVCIAATDGVRSRRKKTPMVHEFDSPGESATISVCRLTLAYNAALIAKSDACRLLATLGCGGGTVHGFDSRPVPQSIARLWTCFLWLQSPGDSAFDTLLDVKEDVEWPAAFDPVEHLDVLPEVMRICVKLALQRGLGSVCRGQFCIDVDALSDAFFAPHRLDAHFAPSGLRLLCASGHEFGGMVDRVPGDMRVCLPRRVRPIAPCRSAPFRPPDALFLTVLRGGADAVLRRQVDYAGTLRLVNLFRSEFPVWVASYLADLFECR